MATAGDGCSPYESGGNGEKSDKRALPSEIDEETEKASEAARQNVSNGVSDEGGNPASITRSEIQHPTTLENLPGELLLNIFIRLLAKQVAQMRSVSKSWNALLSQPSFVKSHLHRSIHNNDRVLLVFSFGVSSSSDHKPCTAYLRRSPHLELTNFIKLPPADPESGHNPSMLKVIGSVHGLICSRYGDRTIHIWNPSLSAVSTLPPHSIPSGRRYEVHFRFGYDPNTADYKVVKLIGICRPPTVFRRSYMVTEWLQVEVYGMRKGLWELITQRFPSHITSIFRHDGICVNELEGHLHWLCYIDEEKKLQTIVSFDLGSETFREIPLPDYQLDGKHHNVLGVLGGKLCMMSRDWTGEIDVWVMDEYGAAESWIKRHIFSHTCSHLLSFGVAPHSEFLTRGHDNNLYLYAPIGKTAKILDYFRHGRSSADKVIEYVDSLVWVEPWLQNSLGATNSASQGVVSTRPRRGSTRGLNRPRRGVLRVFG